MRISNIKVSNYRNIDGIGVCFNPGCNYIIGENNLGKSNFLSLLGTVCNGKGFDEKDFSERYNRKLWMEEKERILCFHPKTKSCWKQERRIRSCTRIPQQRLKVD